MANIHSIIEHDLPDLAELIVKYISVPSTFKKAKRLLKDLECDELFGPLVGTEADFSRELNSLSRLALSCDCLAAISNATPMLPLSTTVGFGAVPLMVESDASIATATKKILNPGIFSEESNTAPSAIPVARPVEPESDAERLRRELDTAVDVLSLNYGRHLYFYDEFNKLENLNSKQVNGFLNLWRTDDGLFGGASACDADGLIGAKLAAVASVVCDDNDDASAFDRYLELIENLLFIVVREDPKKRFRALWRNLRELEKQMRQFIEIRRLLPRELKSLQVDDSILSEGYHPPQNESTEARTSFDNRLVGTIRIAIENRMSKRQRNWLAEQSENAFRRFFNDNSELFCVTDPESPNDRVATPAFVEFGARFSYLRGLGIATPLAQKVALEFAKQVSATKAAEDVGFISKLSKVFDFEPEQTADEILLLIERWYDRSSLLSDNETEDMLAEYRRVYSLFAPAIKGRGFTLAAIESLVCSGRITAAQVRASSRWAEIDADAQQWIERQLKPLGNPEEETRNKTLQQALAELDSLIGLPEVKSEVRRITNGLKIQKELQKHGLPTASDALHFVFTGNPGTGKTTVARILGRILYGLGILRTDKMIETDRSRLVGEYLGSTAIKVDQVVDSALDGVLFIDEAYQLVASTEKGAFGDQFGQEAVTTLLMRMENNRDRLVVIVAGYPEEMRYFIDSNPGLESRFTRFIQFENYTVPDLCRIFESNCQSLQLSLTPAARAKLFAQFALAISDRNKHFSNARFVRNVFQKAVSLQRDRLATGVTGDLDRTALTTLEDADVPIDMGRGTVHKDVDLTRSEWEAECPSCFKVSKTTVPFLGEVAICDCGQKYKFPWWNIVPDTVPGLPRDVIENSNQADRRGIPWVDQETIPSAKRRFFKCVWVEAPE